MIKDFAKDTIHVFNKQSMRFTLVVMNRFTLIESKFSLGWLGIGGWEFACLLFVVTRGLAPYCLQPLGFIVGVVMWLRPDSTQKLLSGGWCDRASSSPGVAWRSPPIKLVIMGYVIVMLLAIQYRNS